MSKWFDANGTDVDAYPNQAFKGGVYEHKTVKPTKYIIVDSFTEFHKLLVEKNGQNANPEVNTSEKDNKEGESK